MIKIAVIACHETEDIELIVPTDVWRKAGMRVDLISLDKKNSIILQSGTKISCNGIIEKCNFSQYNAIYLPGGCGSKKYFLSEWTPKNIDVIHRLHKALHHFSENEKKYVLAMDEAPKILVELNLLSSKTKIVGSDKIAKELKGFYVNDKKILANNNTITAKNIGDVFDFALLVVETLLDKKALNNIKNIIN